MTDHYVIGVDAGGTKTTAWLANRNGHLQQQPLATGSSGPGNVRSVGFDAAVTNIQTAITKAIASRSGTIDRLCICAAGAGRMDEQNRLREWADSQHLASRIRIATDVEAVLAAASEDPTGVALIAGTGSLAWGRNSDGQTHRAGGWGHLLGDEGSAYDIAMKSLRCAVRMADGREVETPLLQTMMRELRVNAPTDLIAIVYSESMSKDHFASLAKCVFDTAESGDSVAAMIIENAVSELALMVKTVSKHLHLKDSFPLAVTGGVLVHQPTFRLALLQHLDHPVENTHVVDAPVRGAVALARLLTTGDAVV